ncbi:MAG TPA: hypothetical protein VI547_12410, partial [Anaerolineales bacterium]|nr:hypothetical protein [Anaerolineales bacterium]
ANTLATAIELVALTLILRRRLNGLGAWTMIGSVGRSALAALGMGLAVWGWVQGVAASRWGTGLGGVVVGVGVFFALALVLRSPELSILRRRKQIGEGVLEAGEGR